MAFNSEEIIELGKKLGTGILNTEGWGQVGSHILHSNEAIDKDAIEKSKGIAGTILRTMGGEKNIGKAVKEAYTNEGGGLNYGAIAGSYLGVSAAYRVASGGGLYRDKNGNTNLIGVPFI